MPMKPVQYLRCICLLGLMLSCFLSSAQNEKENVLRVVRDFFDTIEKSDSVKFKDMFLPEARFHIARSEGSKMKYATRLAAVPFFKPPTQYSERMRATGVKVEVHQQIAMAWVPYDFYVDNKFSHCGIDVFTLMKTDTGWKIASLSFSTEKEGCAGW